MSLVSCSRLIAATLMIGAIAAPAASARSDLAAAGTPSGVHTYTGIIPRTPARISAARTTA